MGLAVADEIRVARRAVREIVDGMVINLGIGMPTLVVDFIPSDIHVLLQAENGMLGYGPAPEEGAEDPYVTNAGGFPALQVAGASYFDSALAFGMIRCGRVDMTILGALQVSEYGDLANWQVPGRRIYGYGGAIELAQKAKKVVVATTHMSREGETKIVKECTLPITARQCVDLIITDMAVIRVTSSGLVLEEVAAGRRVEEVVEATAAKLTVSRPLGSFE